MRLARGRRQGEQRAAVIAGAEGDDAVFAGPAAVHPVLARELQRRLDRLRSTTKEVELGEIARQGLGQLAGEVFDGAVGELCAGDVAELPRLLGESIRDLGIRVAQVGDIGTADGIDVALAALVDEPAPFAAHDFGILMRQLAVEDVAVGVAIAAHTGEATVATPIGRV